MAFEVLVTIGRMVIVGNENDVTPQYVNSFQVSYSLDGNTWENITDTLSLTEV